MQNFSLNIKTRIYFGTNITGDALAKEADNISGNIMIVTTGRSLERYGYVKQLSMLLESNSRVEKVNVYDNISNNPKLTEVKDAIRIGKQNRVDMIVGFGGGSAIDAAKAVAVGISTDNNIEKYLFEGMTPGEETLPIIAIPTTAGTGSELSKGAIISSVEDKIKTGIRGENILPEIAIVDAYYTHTVPEKISMETGFDVLAHAVESYVSVKSNIFSEMLSEKAIEIVTECLPEIKADPTNVQAREKICYASMIMGLNLANVGTCLPHRIQYSIGAVTDTSHAAGLIALYPSWLSHEYKVNADKVNRILQLMGLEYVDNENKAMEEFQGFMRSLNLNYNLSGLGITKNELQMLSEKVTGNIRNDKLADEKDIIYTILEESI